MLTKPPFFSAARPRKAAKSGYSTDSTTYGVQRGSHRWGGRECTDLFIQSCRPGNTVTWQGLQLSITQGDTTITQAGGKPLTVT